MILSDLFLSLQWWFCLFILGLIFLPLTHLLFPQFIDRGYIFSKSIAMVILSYLMLVIGILHILPFHFFSLITILIIFSIVFYWVLKKWSNFSLRELYTPVVRWLLIEEILLLVIFLLWAYIRAFSPDHYRDWET